MALSEHEVHALFSQEFPLPVRLNLVRCAIEAFAAARTHLQRLDLERPQKRDLQPALVRAEFETRLSRLIAAGVDVAVRQNCQGTSSFVEISTANATLTALTRRRLPNKLPEALYRDSRAEVSQFTIFDLLNGTEPPPPCAKKPLYGTFVYGGPGDVAHAKVFFPIPGEPLAAILPLNLLLEYEQVARNHAAAVLAGRPTETLARPVVALKPQPKLGEKKDE